MSDDPAVGVLAELTLVIPAANDHVRFARLMASAVAARLGFDYDAIEDVRIAVSELCTAVTERLPEGELTLTFRGGADGIVVTGRAPLSPGTPPPEAPGDFMRQILEAVADEHSFELRGASVHFTLRRRVAPSPA
jgi:hypothetical protein